MHSSFPGPTHIHIVLEYAMPNYETPPLLLHICTVHAVENLSLYNVVQSEQILYVNVCMHA